MNYTIPAALATIVSLTACSSITPASDPNYFLFRMNDGVLSGTYNPAGFNSKQVKFYLGQECTGKKLAGYSEGAPQDAGVVPFKASCQGGLPYNGHYQILRQADGSVLAEGTLAKDGSVFFSQKTY